MMATITSRHVVDDIIRGDGHYGSDPRVMRIVEYENKWNGALAWGLVYATDRDPRRYENSPNCLNPRIIWTVAASEDQFPTAAYEDAEPKVCADCERPDAQTCPGTADGHHSFERECRDDRGCGETPCVCR